MSSFEWNPEITIFPEPGNKGLRWRREWGGCDCAGEKNGYIRYPQTNKSLQKRMVRYMRYGFSVIVPGAEAVFLARKQRLDDGKATVTPWNEAKVRLLRVGQ
jgi:hypothetical protein